MIKINLLSEGKRPAAVRRARSTSFFESESIALWMLVAAVLLLGALPAAGWWWAKKTELAEMNDQIVVAQAEVDELAAIIAEVERFKAQQAELQHKIDVIEQLRANQKGPVRVMDHVSRALPELLWLDRMEMKGNTISIGGRAFNSNAVAAFIDNLDRVEEFQEPILRDLREGREGVYSFNITFNFSFAPPPDEPAEGEAAAPEGETAAPAPAEG